MFFAKNTGLFKSSIPTLLLLALAGHRELLISNKYESPELAPDGELLVAFFEGVSPEFALKSAIEKWGLALYPAFHPDSPDDTNLDDYWQVDIPAKWQTNTLKIVNQISKTSGIRWVEPNEVLSLDFNESFKVSRKPDDSALNDPGRPFLWGFDLMQMEKLYDLLKRMDRRIKKKALIAILDSGVDANHEDIRDNYKSLNPDWDKDPLGHGTHCAGIAAAVSNNEKGIASFSLENNFVEVASIRVLNAAGAGTQKSIIDGIITAADRGAAVISMSLGGRSSQRKQQAYREAIEYASKKGAIVVAAAGNSGINAKNFAPVNAPGLIGVAALDTLGRKAGFSNSVEDIAMAVAAPGVNIYSTIPGNNYASFNGTSMATPYVAGLLGLLKSIEPDLKAGEAYLILKESGMAMGDSPKTGPVILPYKALELLLSR